MSKTQIINESVEMLRAGNLAEDIISFWRESYGVPELQATLWVGYALDQADVFAPQYWTINE